MPPVPPDPIPTETVQAPSGPPEFFKSTIATATVPVPAPSIPVSEAFAEETRVLLRRRLLITHSAVGIVMAVVTILGLLGTPVLPIEAGLGRWVIGLPLLGFGQSFAGWLFLIRRPDAPIGALRFVELTHFASLGIGAGIARFIALSTAPAQSLDSRYHLLLYRFDAVVTNYPLVFAAILYGVLIPNTRRRSLGGAGLLCLVPLVAAAAAAAVNPIIMHALPALITVTILPLFLALVVAVFCAARSTDLRREAFEARHEANQVGAYNLVRKLGEGGMGEVFLAEHRLLKRPCAVKFIRPELASDAQTATRFEREVHAVTALTHPNTVRVYDYGRGDDGSFYYVMEYLVGPTLDRLVKESGPLSPGRAVYLLRQLCGALGEAHADGLVHRDLKPGNILVATLGGQHDVAKLLDFGLVHCMSEAADARLTVTGMVLGTPTYMCPEQAGGEAAIDARGDIYSLGAVAFFALTGRPPFESTSVGKLLAAHLSQIPPSVSAIRKEIPADLAAIVARCLAKNPAERFQSVAEMEKALAACGCAGDWSAEHAEKWWADNALQSARVAPEPTRSHIDPEQTKK